MIIPNTIGQEQHNPYDYLNYNFWIDFYDFKLLIKSLFYIKTLSIVEAYNWLF